MKRETVGNLIKGLFEQEDEAKMWERIENDFSNAVSKKTNELVRIAGFGDYKIDSEEAAKKFKEIIDEQNIEFAQWRVTEDFPFNTVTLLKKDGEILAMYTTFVESDELIVSDITIFKKEA